MRHRVYGRKLSRTKNERLALFRGLVRSLVLEGTLTTTEAKAKAIKPLVDRLITAGRKNSPASQRLIQSAVSQSEVMKKILDEIAPSFKTRNSGFTSMIKLGVRPGDGSMMVKMSWVSEEVQSPKQHTLPSGVKVKSEEPETQPEEEIKKEEVKKSRSKKSK